MKNTLMKLLLAMLFTVPFSAVQAQIPPAVTTFDATSGKLKIVPLIFSGRNYYMEMTVVDAATLTMQINANSLVDITPDGSTTGKTAADVVGTWKVQGEETTLTLNEDGTFRVAQAAGTDDDSCAEGGDETGTFRYTPVTAVFLPTFLTDENGDCGLSGDGLIRIYTDGNTLTVNFHNEGSTTLVRVE